MTATRCLSFLALLLAAAVPRPDAARAAPVDGPVKLVPVWKLGETARYEMTREQARKVGAAEPTRSVAWTQVEVEVVDADEDGVVLRWMQGSAMYDDPKSGDDPLVRTLNTIFKGVDVDLELDADGTYVGVRNWKEVKATGHKIQDVMLKNLEKMKAPKATVESVRAVTDPLFASKESVEAAFGKQPALLVRPLGKAYEAGKAVTYDDTFPNPVPGGDPIPTKGERTFKVSDPDAGVARVTFKQTPDQTDVNRITEQALRDAAKKAGKAAPEQFPEFKLEDVVEYEVEVKTGWVRSVTHTRTVTVGDTTQTEVVTITRKAD